MEWEFAQKFTAYQGAKFGACCANGTVGIQMALEALGIGAYDEVIVPGMTWQATAAACVDVNAVPVLCDVEPDTYNLDLDKVEAAITPKTKAIIVVHLYGCVTDLDRPAAHLQEEQPLPHRGLRPPARHLLEGQGRRILWRCQLVEFPGVEGPLLG